jgi:predicted Rdx family selenoprotein
MSDASIIYCRPCGYEKRAKDAAAALRERLAVEARLVPGTGGNFEVRVKRQSPNVRKVTFPTRPRSSPRVPPHASESAENADWLD